MLGLTYARALPSWFQGMAPNVPIDVSLVASGDIPVDVVINAETETSLDDLTDASRTVRTNALIEILTASFPRSPQRVQLTSTFDAMRGKPLHLPLDAPSNAQNASNREVPVEVAADWYEAGLVVSRVCN